MYYVYEWFIIETGEIIYVGKGTRNRYKVRKHNKLFNEMIRRYQCTSRIVKKFDNEKDAFAFEYEHVKELKAVNQCVCNIYDGGFGGTDSWWTEVEREKYSENNVMKSEKQRKRMSDNNPMKNPDIAQKANSKKKRAIVIGDKEYSSIRDAQNELGVSYSTITKWCMHGVTDSGELAKYKDADVFLLFKPKNDGHAKSVIYRGKHYCSSSELARELGVAQTTTARWCRNGRDTYGNPCYYEDEKREIINSTDRKNISVIVNGKWYPSKVAASKELKISTYILTQYLDKKKQSTEYICEYGNQKPSQGNTNNSTLEGSTTNG